MTPLKLNFAKKLAIAASVPAALNKGPKSGRRQSVLTNFHMINGQWCTTSECVLLEKSSGAIYKSAGTEIILNISGIYRGASAHPACRLLFYFRFKFKHRTPSSTWKWFARIPPKKTATQVGLPPPHPHPRRVTKPAAALQWNEWRAEISSCIFQGSAIFNSNRTEDIHRQMPHL